MVNSARRIREMREFARGKLQEWNCRASQNTSIIRTDGSLAPAFLGYPAYDWGTGESPKVRIGTAAANQTVLPTPLLFDPESHRALLLRRYAGRPMAV